MLAALPFEQGLAADRICTQLCLPTVEKQSLSAFSCLQLVSEARGSDAWLQPDSRQ